MKMPTDMKLKVDKIVDYLKTCGSSRIVLFGSFAEGTNGAHSDIDIAVGGISGKEFFTAVASLPYLVKHRVDLVDFDALPPKYREMIEQNGVLLYAN
jgi:predicted nucleotidyltransferase